MGEKQGWRCLTDIRTRLGESTLWDDRDGCIYWVDIDDPHVHWLNLASGRVSSWTPPTWISALAIREQGGFVASCADGFAYVDPEKRIYAPFADPIPQRGVARLNDGMVDREGRYWSGSCDNSQWDDSTTSENKEDSLKEFDARSTGELYRLDPSGTITTMERDIVTSNGPAFSPDGKTAYFNDSMPLVTWAYDLSADGSLSNRREFLKFTPADGYPDGMAVDAAGGIWICFFESWVLRRFAPDATLLEERRLPVRQGLRPAFGGEHLDRLFMSSGMMGLSAQALAEQPLAGGLFEILEPGVCGLPAVAFAG